MSNKYLLVICDEWGNASIDFLSIDEINSITSCLDAIDYAIIDGIVIKNFDDNFHPKL